jgi:predicted nuclease with TOPRIM domain
MQSQQAISALKSEVNQLEGQLAQKRAEIKTLQGQKAELEQELAVQVEVAATSKSKLTSLQESINTTTRQRIPDGLQEKIDQLTYQLRQTQILAMDVQQNMIPVEESIVNKSSSSNSTTAESSQSQSANASAGSKSR